MEPVFYIQEFLIILMKFPNIDWICEHYKSFDES